MPSCLLTWYDPALGGVNSAGGIANPTAQMANGQPYNANADTCAAPPQYAFGTNITFTYQGRSVTCTVTDRGGAIIGNHFDLSRHAAETLGIINAGSVTASFTVGGRSRGSVGSALSGILRPTAAPADTGAAVDKLLSQYNAAMTRPRSQGSAAQFVAGLPGPQNAPQSKKGIPKNPKDNNPLGFLTDPLTEVADAIQSALDFLKFIAWVFHPVNLLRGVEFLTGVVLMGFGIQATAQSFKESRRGGYRGRRNALQRSAAGRAARTVVRATPAGRAERVVRGARAGRRSARREQYYREYDRSYRSSRRKTERRQSEKQTRREQRRKP